MRSRECRESKQGKGKKTSVFASQALLWDPKAAPVELCGILLRTVSRPHPAESVSSPACFPCWSKSSLLTWPCCISWLPDCACCSGVLESSVLWTEKPRDQEEVRGRYPRARCWDCSWVRLSRARGGLVVAEVATVSGQGQEDMKQCTRGVTYPPPCITQISSCLPVNSFQLRNPLQGSWFHDLIPGAGEVSCDPQFLCCIWSQGHNCWSYSASSTSYSNLSPPWPAAGLI